MEIAKPVADGSRELRRDLMSAKCYLRRFGGPVWACIDLPLSHVCSIVADIADFLHAIEVQAGFFGTSL